MENLNWLDIVLDYCKRFPNKTVKDLGLETCTLISNCNLCEIFEETNEYRILSILNSSMLISVFSTDIENGCGRLECWDGNVEWKPVPLHILLRFLTEGKEDLV